MGQVGKTKATKATKKFIKKNLKKEIVRRKEVKKITDSNRRKEKRSKQAEELGNQKKAVRVEEKERQRKQRSERSVEDLNIDEVFTDKFFKTLDDEEEDQEEDQEQMEDNEEGEEEGEEDEEPTPKSKSTKSKKSTEDDEEEEEDDEEDEELELSGDDSDADLDDQEGEKEEEEEGDVMDQITKHRDELEELKKHDPEFLKYLQQTDKDLLSFGDEEIEEEENEQRQQREFKQAEEDKRLLTVPLLKKFIKNATELKSISAVKRLVLAFRSAVRIGEEREDGKKTAYTIPSSSVFNKLMVYCLKNMASLFDIQLDRIQDDNRPVSRPKKWEKMKSIVKTFLNDFVQFLGQVSEETMLSYLLRHAAPFIPYFKAFSRISKRLLQSLLEIWSGADETSRILSFMMIRTMALQMGPGFLNMCLKGCFHTYVRNAKFTNARTLPIIKFMVNCLVEIYSIDFAASYQHIFVYVRQLALHLRTAIQNKGQEKQKSIYNWQFVNSLRVWAHVLAKNPKQEQLKVLVYPMIQIIIATIRVAPSSRHFAVRFQCIRYLHLIASATGVFINTSPYILECLNVKELNTKSKLKGSSKGIHFNFNLRISKQLLMTKPFADAIIEEVEELIFEYLTIYSTSISFPEMSIPTRISLKRFAKESPTNPIYKKKLQTILQLAESNSRFVSNIRHSIDFSPRNVPEEMANYTKQESPLKAGFKTFQAQKESQRKVKAYDYDDEEHEDDVEGDSEEEGEDEEGDGYANPYAKQDFDDEDDEDAGFEDDQDDDDDDGDDEEDDDEEDERPQKKQKQQNGKSSNSKKQQQKPSTKKSQQTQQSKGKPNKNIAPAKKSSSSKSVLGKRSSSSANEDVVEDLVLSD